MKKIVYAIYIADLILLVLYSYGFVDGHFPYRPLKFIYHFLIDNRIVGTYIYVGFVVSLFIFYAFFLRLVIREKISKRDLLSIIVITVAILFFAFPGFSYDIFNYISTAKLTYLYKENPYIIMPIDIPNEPMLAYTHGANKIALYGPAWIILTLVPFLLSFGNILVSVFVFKLFVIVFYFLTLFFIWKLSKNNLYSVAFFALNPLVLLEILVGAHNDIVMMCFALGFYYYLQKKKLFLALLFLVFSIGIKYASFFLLPVVMVIAWYMYTKKTIQWEKIWFLSALTMYGIFFLSPLREEIYSWYFVWPLVFVSLLPRNYFLTFVTLGFCFGLPLRIAPYIYTGSWIGITPVVKKIVTFLPPAVMGIIYVIKKQI